MAQQGKSVLKVLIAECTNAIQAMQEKMSGFIEFCTGILFAGLQESQLRKFNRLWKKTCLTELFGQETVENKLEPWKHCKSV